MKIDSSRYYCFGCGEKGDAIDFVAKFYGLGKKEAALQIASVFGISVEDNRGRKPQPKRKRRLSPEQRFEKAEKRCFPCDFRLPVLFKAVERTVCAAGAGRGMEPVIL